MTTNFENWQTIDEMAETLKVKIPKSEVYYDRKN